jgi:hypothetical protein
MPALCDTEWRCLGPTDQDRVRGSLVAGADHQVSQPRRGPKRDRDGRQQAQGYLFSPPIPAETLRDRFANGHGDPVKEYSAHLTARST